MFRKLAATLVLAGAVAIPVLASAPASASTSSHRYGAYSYAVHHRGCWYAWGGTGPCSFGYDCSGLVVAAYASQGVGLPRTTYEMLASSKLVRISHSQAREGDLAFFGTGHVELVRWSHETIGALTFGTTVNYHRWYSGSWWQPSGYYHVRGAG
jgi:cell wall-associated NlpC family hydrolase